MDDATWKSAAIRDAQSVCDLHKALTDVLGWELQSMEFMPIEKRAAHMRARALLLQLGPQPDYAVIEARDLAHFIGDIGLRILRCCNGEVVKLPHNEEQANKTNELKRMNMVRSIYIEDQPTLELTDYGKACLKFLSNPSQPPINSVALEREKCIREISQRGSLAYKDCDYLGAQCPETGEVPCSRSGECLCDLICEALTDAAISLRKT